MSHELAVYYPLTVMETGADILFFWVARMAMLCSFLTNQVPFKTVLLHPLVRDAKGRKMSKSLGNVIDPIHIVEGRTLQQLKDNVLSSNVTDPQEIKRFEWLQTPTYPPRRAIANLETEFPHGIEQCGTDALRFALAEYTQQASSINLDIHRVVSYRKFCNKIWNAVRYVLGQLEGKPVTHDVDSLHATRMVDKWILSRLADAVQECNRGFASFQISTCTAAIYSFFLHEFCDVYLEFSKSVFYAKYSVPLATQQVCM